jgi:hypothetical protein
VIRPIFVAAALLLMVSAGGCAEEDPYAHREHFEIRGLHLALDCADCHDPASRTMAVGSDCADCHVEDRPLIHDEQGCAFCHTEAGFELPRNAHLFWPLKPGHVNVDCIDCHLLHRYEGTEPECVSCHHGDLPTDTLEEHYGGRPCEECHQATRWDDFSAYPHPAFPKPHFGVSDCVGCHPGEDMTTFTCTDCHDHESVKTYLEHTEVEDYQYESQACLDCHPDGLAPGQAP